MKLISRLLAWLREPEDRIAIDMEAAWLASERRKYAWIHHSDEFARYKRRTAGQVIAWASSTVSKRVRPPTPWAMNKEVVAWLPGLTAEEIIVLSKCGRTAVAAHVFDGPLIDGVRLVQPLETVVLTFPVQIAPAETLNDRSSGGIRRKSGDVGGSSWRRI